MIRILIVAAVLAFISLPARSEDYTMQVRSLHPNTVLLKFYSRTRKGKEWPSSTRAWVLDDDNVHRLKLVCRRGERICFGAWVSGSKTPEWGAGVGGSDKCQHCCFTCGDPSPRGFQTLNVKKGTSIPTQIYEEIAPPRPPKATTFDDD